MSPVSLTGADSSSPFVLSIKFNSFHGASPAPLSSQPKLSPCLAWILLLASSSLPCCPCALSLTSAAGAARAFYTTTRGVLARATSGQTGAPPSTAEAPRPPQQAPISEAAA